MRIIEVTVIQLICLMVEQGCKLLHPINFAGILSCVNDQLRILDKICPYRDIYTLDNVITTGIDSSLLDDNNWKPIQLQLVRLQSNIERLTHIMEYCNGKLNS